MPVIWRNLKMGQQIDTKITYHHITDGFFKNMFRNGLLHINKSLNIRSSNLNEFKTLCK